MTICPLDAEYTLKPEEIVPDLPFFEVALDDTQPFVASDFTRDTLTGIGKREVTRVINYTRQMTIKQVLAQGPRRPVAMIQYPQERGPELTNTDRILRAHKVEDVTMQIPRAVIEKDREDEIDRLIEIWNEDAQPKKKHFKRLRTFCRMVGLAITIAIKEDRDGR
jgi:hypothetical protein